MPKKKAHSSYKTKLIIAIVAFLGSVVISIVYLLSSIPIVTTKEIALKEKTISGIVSTLSKEKVIDHPYVFYVLTTMYQVISGRDVYSGELILEPTISHARLLKMVFSGQSGMTINVVIHEGS
ncbi:MAG: hypothetical protein ACO323_06675, partial [Candidatus Kapaibacteriota bacterium]